MYISLVPKVGGSWVHSVSDLLNSLRGRLGRRREAVATLVTWRRISHDRSIGQTIGLPRAGSAFPITLIGIRHGVRGASRGHWPCRGGCLGGLCGRCGV